MSESYGNRTYPGSRRIYSRPFAWSSSADLPEPERKIAELQKILHEIGELVIGRTYGDFCCDTDRYLPHAIGGTLVTSRYLAVENNAHTIEEYGDRLTLAGRKALDTLLAEMRRAEAKRSFIKPDIVLGPMKTLWAEDPSIDPRLTCMETVFMSAADDIRLTNDMELFEHRHSDPQRFMATLEWAARPQNAKAIAGMFLYSRLAQHFGETNPGSLVFAKAVHDDLASGQGKMVLRRLTREPEAYYLDATGQDIPLMLAQRNVAARTVPFLFNGLARGPAIKNRDALIASIPAMVKDHGRLLDGSWARRNSHDMERKTASLSKPALAIAGAQECNR